MADSTLPVVVIGAGVAGLCCALDLQAANVPVQLLDAADAPGGRLRTDVVEGFRLDRGFQVLLTAYPEAETRLDYRALDLRRFEPGALIRKAGGWHLLADPWRRPWQAWRGALARVGTLADKLLVGKLRSDSRKGHWEQRFREPERTTLEELQGRGFSEGMIAAFFRPFLGGIFLERELTTSNRMLHFVFRMFSAGDAAIPALGMQQIPEQLAERLRPGVLRLKTRVIAVRDGQVELDDGTRIDAARVVLATDGAAAHRLLGRPQGPATCGVTCLYFAATEAPAQDTILVLNGDGTGPINNLCVPSLLAPEVAPPGQHLVSVSVVDRDAQAAPDLVTRVREQLVEWYGPAARAWRHLKTYAIPEALPARPARGLPAEFGDGEPIVCGDHASYGSLQHAMMSGGAAARRVLMAR